MHTRPCLMRRTLELCPWSIRTPATRPHTLFPIPTLPSTFFLPWSNIFHKPPAKTKALTVLETNLEFTLIQSLSLIRSHCEALPRPHRHSRPTHDHTHTPTQFHTHTSTHAHPCLHAQRDLKSEGTNKCREDGKPFSELQIRARVCVCVWLGIK